ncbi:PaaI family thioesterase [Pseudonocardia sp. P1]
MPDQTTATSNVDTARRHGRTSDALRRLLDAVTAASADDQLLDEAEAALTALAVRFEQDAASIADQVVGRIDALDDRGQFLVPVFNRRSETDDRVSGTVRFGRFHHGLDGTVHGGALALFLEEILGTLAVRARTTARTAFLHVDYRSGTPIDRDLNVEAWYELEDGRKRFLRASVHDGETLCAEAQALCVALRQT